MRLVRVSNAHKTSLLIMSTIPAIVEEAYTILLQLGDRRFLAMTGANNLIAAGHTASNPIPGSAWTCAATKRR